MDKKQALSVVKDYKKAISQIVEPSTVYLYGSYSKGTANENSDIDVAVIVPKLQSNWLPTVARLWKASRKVNPLIEPVLIEEGEQSPLYDEIKKWGIVVQ